MNSVKSHTTFNLKTATVRYQFTTIKLANSFKFLLCKKGFSVSSQVYRPTNPLIQVLVEAGTVTLGCNLENSSKDECGHILHGRYIPRKALPWVPVDTAAWLLTAGPGRYQNPHHYENRRINFHIAKKRNTQQH